MKTSVEPEESLYRIFEEHGAELYWLAFLLTGDPEQGVAAFTRALEFKESANPVFRGFMISWARKLIIAEALGGIRSELRESVSRSQAENWSHGRLPAEWKIARRNVSKEEFERAVLKLQVFSRCAVLLTIFERMSIQEAAVLLSADVELVKKAQLRGLVELTRNMARGRGWSSSREIGEGPLACLRSALSPVFWPNCTN